MNLLKLTDVFGRLQVSPATGYRLVRDGVIPVVVLSRGSRRRLLRVREEDLEEALRSVGAGESTRTSLRADSSDRSAWRHRRRRRRRTRGGTT